jgi:hypothetical protein
MIQFFEEKDTKSKPPERQGEKPPEEDRPWPESKRIYWDGSEAELVSDDTALSFEEQHTGIMLKYTLTSSEIFKALIKTQYTFSRKMSSAFAVILSLCLAVFFITKTNTADSVRYVSLASVCFLTALVVSLIPSIMIKLHSMKIADGKEINMKIYPDHIQMNVGTTNWEIPLDGTCESVRVGNLIVIYIKDSFVILPLRCVEPSVMAEVQAMIVAGTNAKL